MRYSSPNLLLSAVYVFGTSIAIYNCLSIILEVLKFNLVRILGPSNFYIQVLLSQLFL